MTLSGSNFDTGAVVNFGASSGISATYGAGVLSFTVPESEFYETGTKNVTVTYNGQTSNAVTFTVTQPSILIQDLRADRGITLNGSTVSAWSSYDTSGDANRTVSQATASQQPTYVASNSSFNNKPTVNFSETSVSKLVSGTFSTGTWAQTTIAAVGSSKLNVGSSNTAGLYLCDGLLSTDRTVVYFPVQSGVERLTVYRAGGEISNTLSDVYTPSAMFIHFEGAIGSSTTLRSFIRSASNGVGAAVGANAGQTGVTLGARFAQYSGNGSWNGPMAEFLMFNAPLTQTQRTRLGNYFSNRYGSGVMTP